MNSKHTVSAPQPRERRRGGVYFLAIAPIVVAATIGVLATSVIPATGTSAQALSAGVGIAGVQKSVAVSDEFTPAVVAPTAAAFRAEIQSVKVTPVVVPEPVVVAPRVTPAPKSAAPNATAPHATAPKSSSTNEAAPKAAKAPSVSYTKYCAAPASPYSATSSDIKALLTAANKERARIGAGSLSWSNSLASAALSWSRTMAAKDDTTKAHYDALSHNPNRPGAENVAVSYSSAGLAKSAAIGKAHVNWMYSEGHCLNIMNPAYSTMGAGTAQTEDGNSWYTTQNFR